MFPKTCRIWTAAVVTYFFNAPVVAFSASQQTSSVPDGVCSSPQSGLQAPNSVCGSALLQTQRTAALHANPELATYASGRTQKKAPAEIKLTLQNQGSVAQLIQRQEVRQPSAGESVTVTSESFFEKMSNAFAGVIVGIVMIIFSVPALWLNEKRNAKYESLISKGAEECREITADNYDGNNTNWLVHATGATTSVKPVADKQFNVRYETGVIKLSSVVEIYQYSEVEKSETQKKDTLGGGTERTTRTWQEYPAGWHPHYDSGASFKDPQYRNVNSKPMGLEAGSYSQTCERVEFGAGFLLGDAELSQFEDGASPTLKDKLVCTGNASLSFARDSDGRYYCCKGSASSPQIGDVRVCFKVLDDGPATIVGLQVAGKETERGGFMPYRVIRRPACPCCPISEDKEKELLLAEAKKSAADLVAAETWGGIMWCCCCPCNIISMCCAGALAPELHHVWRKTMTKAACFDNIASRAAMMTWILRLVGWLMMFVGLYLTFMPLTTMMRIIPFGIGTFLESFGNAIVGVWSFMVTLVLAVLIVSLAYTMYHPVVGMIAFSVLFAIIAGIVVFANAKNSA